jgi:hypothetical protein
VTGDETANKIARGIESLDVSITRPGGIVFFLGVLQCVSDVNVTIEITNAKRGVACT